MLRAGLDQNFIHFLLGFIKGPNKIVKGSVGRGPLPGLTIPLTVFIYYLLSICYFEICGKQSRIHTSV
jgi:hypothetical protein